MARFVLFRLLRLVLVLFGVSIVAFSLLSLLPGDPVLAILNSRGGLTGVSIADVERLTAALRLDEPLHVRYLLWLGDALRGDFGISYDTDQPVAGMIASRLPITLEIAALALLISLAIGIPLGAYSAYRANSLFDRASSTFTFGLLSLPQFVLAVLLVYLFGVSLRVFPVAGWIPFSEDPVGNLRTAFMPAIALGLPLVAVFARFIRSDMITTLQRDFVVAARARGFSMPRVLFGHALRPSAGSLLTIVALQTETLLGGAVLVEKVFGLPGLGRLMVDSTVNRDLFVVQTLALLFGAAFVIANALADLAAGIVDPRTVTAGGGRG